MTRQNAPASGVPTGLPSYITRGAAAQQRRVDDVAVADDPADIGRGPVHVAGVAGRRSSASSSTARRRGRHCRAPRPWAGRSCRRCTGYTADRSPATGTQSCGAAAASAAQQIVVAARRQSAPRPASRCRIRQASGLCGDIAIAASSSGLYLTTRPAPARRTPRRSPSAWRRRCGSPVRPPRSRRTRPNGRRPAGRRRAWRSRPPAPSACRSPRGRPWPRPGRPARRPASRCGRAVRRR